MPSTSEQESDILQEIAEMFLYLYHLISLFLSGVKGLCIQYIVPYLWMKKEQCRAVQSASPVFTLIIQPYIRTKLPKTKRRMGTSGELGVIYEKKILLLGLYRALTEGYDFTLDTNIEKVGAFDDVVLTYKESDGIQQRMYLQAKHKEDERKKIKYEDLLKEGNEEYALFKYFLDYVETMRNFKTIKNKYFIIYTNIDFQGEREDARGLRINKKSDEKYFVFRKINVSELEALKIFSVMDSRHPKKFPTFYRFSDVNQRGENEKSRVVSVLKMEFQLMDKKNKLTTLTEDELMSLLEGFFESLIFAVDQLDQAKLGNHVKGEIKQRFSESLAEDHVDFIFEYALNRISQWKLRNAKPLTANDNFFTQGERKFKTFPALYPTLMYENELNSFNIWFQKEKHEELNKFIFSEAKLWIIYSNATWLNSLVIYQGLYQKTLKVKNDLSYANRGHYFFLTCSELLKEPKLLLDAFETVVQSLLIVVFQPTDAASPKAVVIFEKIAKIVADSVHKKIIVIAPKRSDLLEQLRQKVIPVRNQEHPISLSDLTPQSQKTCLMVKKIRFQGQSDLFSIQELLGLEEQFPISKEVLIKLNLNLTESELETLIECPLIEMGSDSSKLNRLESACYNTSALINLDELKDALVANPKDIFALAAQQNEMESCLSSHLGQEPIRFEDGLTPKCGGYFFLNAGEEEAQFKTLCHTMDGSEIQRAIHLIKRVGENWIWAQTYNPEFYIERDYYPVTVDAEQVKHALVKRKLKFDFVIFSGTNEEALLEFLNIPANKKDECEIFKHNASVFLQEIDAREKFNQLALELKQNDKSVHWLKIKERKGQKHLHWYSSQGGTSQLHPKQLMEGVAKTPFTEAILANSTAERVVILLDEPGTGKTTNMLRLSQWMKKVKPLSWVMYFDLSRHQLVMDSKQLKTMDDFIDILSNIDSKLANPITRRILMHRLTSPGHVTFLLDGFDEVLSERRDSVLTLFEFIENETAATFWIAARRNDGELKEHFSFVPLDRAKQIYFLSRFWSMTLKLTVKNADMSILESYAKEVIEHFERSVSAFQTDTNFISVPLGVRMIAEVYQEQIKNALIESKHSLNFLRTDEQFGIVYLFQKFVNKKYDTYFYKMSDRLDKHSKRFMAVGYTEAYEILALRNLFGDEKIKDLVKDEKETFDSDMLNLLSQIGLIRENAKPATFIHRTFAEYFAAKWLAENTNNSCVKKFIGIHLFKDKFSVWLRFFDVFLTEKLPLHRATLQNNMPDFKAALDKNFDINLTDSLGRTALHLAAQEGRAEMIPYLLKKRDNKLFRDESGKTALHYASNFGHYKIIDQLLENDNDIGEETSNKPDDVGFKPVDTVNGQDEEGRTPLWYAADKEHWKTACTLLFKRADVSVLTLEQKEKLLRFIATLTKYHKESVSYVRPYVRPEHQFHILGLLSILSLDSDEVPHIFNFKTLQECYCFVTDVDNTNSSIIIVNELCRLASRLSPFSNTDQYVWKDTEIKALMQQIFERIRKLGLGICEEDIHSFLSSAASSGFLETFRYLYEYEKDKTEIFQPEKTMANKEMIEKLFANLQDINVKDPWLRNLMSTSSEAFGWTRLHLAAMGGYLSKDFQFYSNSIDGLTEQLTYETINSRDTFGYTPLAYAAIHGNSEFIEGLFSGMITVNLNDKEQIYEIVNAKNNINGMAPLHWVIFNNHYDSAKVLLKNIENIGFEQEQLFNIVNSRDFKDRSPVGCVALNNVDILKLLLKYLKSFDLSMKQFFKMYVELANLLEKLIASGAEEEKLLLISYIGDFFYEFKGRTDNANEHDIIEKENSPSNAVTNKDEFYKLFLSMLETVNTSPQSNIMKKIVASSSAKLTPELVTGCYEIIQNDENVSSSLQELIRHGGDIRMSDKLLNELDLD